MTSQKIQNNIITFLAGFIKENINEDLSEYFTKSVDKVTNQFSKKRSFPVMLTLCNLPKWSSYIMDETFFDSMHINGHPTGQAISKSILFLSEKE